MRFLASEIAGLLAAFAAAACALGAFLHWGSLSDVPHQAEIVASTRPIVALLALVGGGLAWAGRFWPWYAACAPAFFLLVAVIMLGEVGYEQMQAHYGNVPSRPEWMLVVMWMALAGAGASAAAAVLGLKERRQARVQVP